MVRGFNLMPNLIRNLRPMASRELDRHASDVYDHMIRSWERGEDSLGEAWTPLAPSTVARKGHSDPLIETGDMMDSAGYDIDRRNMTAEIYIDDPKAAAHEFGLEHIPKRPILDPTATYMEREVENHMGRAIDMALGGGGGSRGQGINISGSLGGFG